MMKKRIAVRALLAAVSLALSLTAGCAREGTPSSAPLSSTGAATACSVSAAGTSAATLVQTTASAKRITTTTDQLSGKAPPAPHPGRAAGQSGLHQPDL